jgi:hypothetical protein
VIPALADAAVRTNERQTHRAVARVEAMPPTEPGQWYDLPVTEAVVTLNEAGVLPGRTLSFTTVEEAVRQTRLTVLGSWLRVRHDVTFWTRPPTELAVPYGYFRVDSLTLNSDGTVTGEAVDAGGVLVSAAAMTLAEKTVPRGTSIIGKITALIESAWPPGGLYRWSTTLLDTTGIADVIESAVGTVHDEDRAPALITLAAQLGCDLVPVVDGTAIYRLVRKPLTTARTGVTISSGQSGNLVDQAVTFDRGSLVNRVHVVWQAERSAGAGGGVGIIQQQRRIVSYDDADSPVRTTGPFGIQSEEVSSNDVDSANEASLAGIEAIKSTLVWNHEYPLSISPVYGLEAGDVLYVEGIGGYVVIGGSIDLLGRWSVIVRRADGTLADAYPHFSVEPVVFEGGLRDDAQWTELAVPGTLDLTLKTSRGWSLTGGTLTAKDGTLILKATSASMTLTSSLVAPVPPLRRVRTKFSMGTSTLNGKGRGYTVSSGINYGGKWYMDGQFAADDLPVDGPDKSRRGESVASQADQQLPSNAATAFGIGAKFTGLAAGQIIRVENVVVEKAGRPK